MASRGPVASRSEGASALVPGCTTKGAAPLFGVVLLASSLGCTQTQSHRSEEVVARIDAEPVHASVVEHVARRDGLDLQAARLQVEDTLRLYAAARARQAETTEPEPLVTPRRREHLVRGAKARLYLEEKFEPDHRAEDIPADHDLMAQAAATSRLVHPRIHWLCQLVAKPTGLEGDALFERAKDPEWMAKARARFEPVAERMRRYIPVGDAEACSMMKRMLRWETKEADGVTLKIDAQGFVLDACLEKAEDGTCAKPQWAPEWTEEVERMQAPGFAEAFQTRFGLHLVYLAEVADAQLLEDPGTDALLREAVLPAWRRGALRDLLAELRHKRAVKFAGVAQ